MALPTIYPALRYKDAPAAITWLVNAFGLTEHMVVEGPGNTIAHAQLAWGDGGMVMLGSTTDGNDGRMAADAGPAWLYLVGAEIVSPLTDQDYGSRDYTARDPEGNLWSFGTYQPAKSDS
jgi:uncharacterized glyoxalase superfamily protein PhnB